MTKKLKKEKKPDLSYMQDDRTLKKVEKYVDKNREKTSKEMAERKSKRPTTKYQEADLEVMISRISNESNPKKSAYKNNKLIIYSIYVIIMIAIVIFCIKYFFI
jgi:hypothetical protein